MNHFANNETVMRGEQKYSRCSGFSLVEVTLAIGIVAFAVLSCVGLNGVSLSSMREAKRTEISGRIFRTVLNEGLICDYTNLSSLQGTSYFDFEGTILSGAAAMSAAPYQVDVEVKPVSFRDGGTAATNLASSSLLVVKIYSSGQKALGKPVTRVAVIGNRAKGLP